MNKELIVKIACGALAIVIVLNFFLYFMGKSNGFIFWFIIALGAFVAYIILPWMKK